MKRIFILFGVLVLGFQISVLAQELEYKFEVGQVLEYERKYTRPQSNRDPNGFDIQTWKYRFEVLEITDQGYRMAMNYLGYYESVLQKSGVYIGGSSSPYSGSRGVWDQIEQAERASTIFFEISKDGQIDEKSFEGLQELYNRNMDLVNENPSYRTGIPYNYFKNKYTWEFYELVISDFFPVLPGALYKDEHIVSIRSEEGIMRSINIWKNKFDDPYDRILYHLERILIFQKSSTQNERSPEEMLINNGRAYWALGNQIFEKITYKGFSLGHLIYELTQRISNNSFDSFKRNAGEIEIINTRNYQKNEKLVIIQGIVENSNEHTIITLNPSARIMDHRQTFVSKKDSITISIQYESPIESGVVKIFFFGNDENHVIYPSLEKQIQIFAQPGDSIRFYVDLNNFQESLRFSGHRPNDQYFLNRQSRDYPAQYPNTSLSTVDDNHRNLNDLKKSISADIFEYLSFEYKYRHLSYQLKEIQRQRNPKIEAEFADTLKSFMKYFGQIDRYTSDGYKEFICDFQSLAMTSSPAHVWWTNPGKQSFESARVYLNGWDRYWFLAHITENRLHTFPRLDYDGLLDDFLSIYGGSEYANELIRLRERLEKSGFGIPFPKAKVIDIYGNRYKINEFKGKTTCILKIGYDRHKEHVMLLVLETVKEEHPDEIRILLLSENFGDSIFDNWHQEIYSGEAIYCNLKDQPSEFVEFIETLPHQIVGFDKDGKIASFNYAEWSDLLNIMTWPQSPPSPKTINRTIFWYAFAGLVTLAFILFIILRVRSKRREAKLALNRKMAELELGAVRSRMNPHFLFNALSSIQNLVNGNEIEKANLYLADFGDLVRSILNQSSKNQISLTEEIDTLKTYLDLEQLRFPFKYSIEVDEKIIPEKIEIPPLFIQPHVENAIIHGLSKLGQDGELRIRFYLKYENLIVMVEDNGEGFQSGIIESNGLGQGWKLTKQRVQLLREQWGKNISVEMMKVEGKSGMRVKFVIPVENKA